MKEFYWFYIEPFVHISLKKNGLLLYNTLNGESIEYYDTNKIGKIVKSLQSKKNLSVIKLLAGQLSDPDISAFIKMVKEKFMGDLLASSWSKAKPVQMVPMLNVQEDVTRYKKKDAFSIGKTMMGNLTEFSFYVNNVCEHNHSLCAEAYKQFLYCTKAGAKEEELDLQEMKEFLRESAGSSLFKVNILGGNILAYSRFEELVSYLDNLKLLKAYYIHYGNLGSQEDKVKKLLAGPNREFVAIHILVHFPVEPGHLAEAVRLQECSPKTVTFNFVLQDEEEYENAEKMISRLKIDNYSLHPFFNGQNVLFFREAVYSTKDEILASKPSLKDIFTRRAINPVNFGKMVVLSNGNIHANVNAARLGKMGDSSLYDVVYKEMYHGRSWRRTRSKVKPCQSCTFETLCPPLSNYEYAVGKNNLCDI